MEPEIDEVAWIDDDPDDPDRNEAFAAAGDRADRRGRSVRPDRTIYAVNGPRFVRGGLSGHGKRPR